MVFIVSGERKKGFLGVFVNYDFGVATSIFDGERGRELFYVFYSLRICI